MPTELDEILRRTMQLEIEREALKKESDSRFEGPAEADRDGACRVEDPVFRPSSAVAEREGSRDRVRGLATQIGAGEGEIAQAERAYDLNKAAELKYGRLTQLEAATQGGGRACKDVSGGTRGYSKKK